MTDFPEPKRSSSIFFLEIDKVLPNPLQPRKEFDENRLSELAESIRQYGILQPLVVARKEIKTASGGVTTEYELIAGERRLRASRLAGLREVPALIREEPTEKIKLEIALVENVQREDLNSVDRAMAFDRLNREFNLSHRDIGARIGKSREYVANSIRLLGLPDEIQSVLREGKITESHARYLLMIQDKPAEQKALLDDIVFRGLNVRETDRILKEIISRDKKNISSPDPVTKNMEEKLAQTFGARVYISKSSNGGRISLEFFSPEELNSFLGRFVEPERQGGQDSQDSFETANDGITVPTLVSAPSPDELEEFTI
ncbi:hypothetical protein A3I27_02800 [Candidatus Giovannonibacteria bacterium RIFCSPLOWO2_02_FULL_43_11b]|uniref:ParB-like N-terminal domain-containing protein n=1 Tax=Candidatus Giovannonibacteria bacterium RIFCSPHIGHO2_12_FULL_43_15 TaxID=1798341 RepID=A0A1F5WS48_9BACT|nr:MAG: hypothetical protein A2739_00025 [Candidatus Giovannonibacteria bacterium RIFCSPHIGHO2_01_FULL_43_100]OGF66109.1 MAG: hypothetical protein A3B97_01235 [Candidatus Giovannonibacteria bacterium RIFCSPHIGHO2_02_FULL_43_32]OGF78071.1 MAG: hypothetical protein A3F23_02610 [Candidatus Giovannonibacteria bacterium RIFCSPHIGHO2_12_FULL_43_15]OGF78808.1 MAG: hypothetical protein A3A15_02370 [Candidatus Giovannonibacteria bacterium RIFCSPLOWO2_01_FULL_43_60]OGF89139.1 MAG: hypothetical protein A3